MRRRTAALALAGDRGGREAEPLHSLDGLPFGPGADDGRAQLQPVLPHLAPAAAAMDLDEETPAADLGLDRAPMLDEAVDPALAIEHPVECVVLRQVLF